MEKANTNMVSRLLVWARENGELRWEWVVDETRRPERIASWSNPAQLLNAAVRQYRRDYWAEQAEWIEVWSEKGTVRGTLAPVLDEYGVTFRVLHGYGSATTLHDIAVESSESAKSLTVPYVGDRDPSGMHMSEIDLPERIDRYGGDIEIVRVAIAEKDTEPDAGVPWFPADNKTRDPRHAWYAERYGTRCWELDALNPVLLRERIDVEIEERLNIDAWNHAIDIEAAEQKSMADFLRQYPGISMPATKYDGTAES